MFIFVGYLQNPLKEKIYLILMCGILGSTIRYPNEKAVFDKKLALQEKRGPDFKALRNFDNGLILGHNRLAIVDLDERANQPFQYKDIVIVYNGEIYNYIDLRNELLLKHYAFRTNSDTEVICAAYLAYGQDCVQKLNGMFAFVIYDPNKQMLFGARDRLGKKPFYYYLSEKGFEFASRLSVIEVGNSLKIDSDSITRYLYWNYIPEPYTPYKAVFKLPAATSFTFDLQSQNFNTFKYWDLPKKNVVTYTDFKQAKSDLKDILNDAVSKRMVADVPVGIFLSGGVDSSLVAAMAQKNSIIPIRTFSVKFNEEGFDESIYAREVAGHLGTNHTEIECSYEEGIDYIKNFSDYYDEPFADSSAIPTLLLSKYTKESVTVALSGDGGDETFLGYNIYDKVLLRKRVYKVPYLIRYGVSKLLKLLPGYRATIVSEGLQLKNIKAYYLSYYKSLNSTWILNKESAPVYWEYLQNDKKNILESISDFDTKTYMNGDCITKVERASMSCSLEVRSPLMDYRVIDFVRKIPTNFKYSETGEKKYILKQVLYDYLPKEIFERKKAGFGMPLNIWFRTILKDYLLEDFSEKNFKPLTPYINRKEFMKSVERHLAGKWDHTPLIWKVLVLSNWFKSREISSNDQ